MLGRELAEKAEIPANYLSKLLLTLRNAGLLSTARGSGGGYSLQKAPNEVHLIDVVELFDAPRARPSCLLGKKECSDHDPCSAHETWREVRRAYIDFLETTSLADIAKPAGASGHEIGGAGKSARAAGGDQA